MKALAVIFLFLGTQAGALELPVGDFEYTHTEATMTKHFHRLYHRSSKERSMIEAYRAEGYLCGKRSDDITECSKTIATNPNQIEFKTQPLADMAPSFSEEIKSVTELSESGAVTIYRVEQQNMANSYQNMTYKVYDITDTGFYVDLKQEGTRSIRFEFYGSSQMSTFTFERERLNKREYLRHSLFSFYRK